jgi:hypothetical protein
MHAPLPPGPHGDWGHLVDHWEGDARLDSAPPATGALWGAVVTAAAVTATAAAVFTLLF